MGLTESEGKAFWPVYEAYQNDLMAINKRIGRLIDSYGAAWDANSLTDEQAAKLITEEEVYSEMRVTADYSLGEDGSVKVVNRGYDAKEQEWKEATGKAWFVQQADQGFLKVSFFGYSHRQSSNAGF